MPYKIDVAPSKIVDLSKNQQDDVLESTNDANKAFRSEKKDTEIKRKDGTIPALKDSDGKDINPHTPLYIMQVPWYYDKLNPTLKHQSNTKEPKKYASISSWYKRGTTGERAKKFTKGACENCGSLTHSKKECFERPRAKGAKFTNADIAENDFVQPNIEVDYDGKRDRWNNYEIEEHGKLTEEFSKVENERRKIKLEQIGADLEDHDEHVDDEDKKEAAGVDQKVDSKQRITVRNLRLREDTAKYLYNLDENSAYYDPKSRSMRQNPFEGKGIEFEQQPIRGDNEFYKSKDMADFYKKQVFAWDVSADEKHANVNLQSNPTQTEKLYREIEEKKLNQDKEFLDKILDQYGGEEHMTKVQEGISEKTRYTEYTQQGTIKNQSQKPIIRSKYIEDVYHNNHTQIFGSYWKDGKWGYKCCQSLIKNSYCGGLKAIAALKASKQFGSTL